MKWMDEPGEYCYELLQENQLLHHLDSNGSDGGIIISLMSPFITSVSSTQSICLLIATDTQIQRMEDEQQYID